MKFLSEHWKDALDGLFALFLILNRLDLVLLRRNTNAAIDALMSLQEFSGIVAGNSGDERLKISLPEVQK